MLDSLTQGQHMEHDNSQDIQQQPSQPVYQLPPERPSSVMSPTTSSTSPHRKRVWLAVAIVVVLAATAWIVFSLHPWQQHASTPSSQPSATPTGDSITIDTAGLGAAYDSFYQHGIKDFSPDKKDQTLQSYDTLTKGFALDSDFQKDQTNLLLSLGIARQAIEDTAHVAAYRSEMFLLMSSHLSSLPDGIADDQFTPQGDTADQQALAVFQKYQDTGLTTRVQQTLGTSGIFATVASSLHLANTDDLANVHIMVMNFNATDNQQFAAEHNMYGARPTMWAELVNHEPYILLTKDYAQSFLDEPTGSTAHKIEHELVHTQHPFVRGELGRSIEERRAEEFSGDHSSYYDVKQLFIYTNIFSGIDVYDMLQQHPTDPDTFYVQLYSTMGVRMANQVIATWPSAFLNQPPAPVTDALALSGGLDGVIQSAVARGKNNQATVDQRLKERADKLVSVFGSKDRVLADIQNNLNEAYGMPTAAAIMKTYVDSHY